jgi:hypothetical protein
VPGAIIDHDRRVFTVTQSWLQDFMRCPERARNELLHPSYGYNDATGLGIATHLFMQERLNGQPFVAAHAIAEVALAGMIDTPEWAWVKVKTPATLFKHLGACIEGFERHVVPQVPCGGMVEQKVSAPLARSGQWRIVLEGTPDYLDPFNHLWDWKTAGSEYNGYEAANWMIQPTSYTYLASRAAKREVTDFTYAIAVKPHGMIQFIDVTRGEQDWRWLSRIALGALMMARSMLHQPWPVNHGHYLCSPNWCAHWDDCRGRYLRPDQEEEAA